MTKVETNDYIQLGWPLIPVGNNKVPLIKDWPNRASIDSELISLWISQFPSCSWGIVPGMCNIAVLDIDPRNGGEESWERIRQDAGIDELLTPEVRTGGGGSHYYFHVEDQLHPSTTIAPGVDLISKTGYVVVPPSLHSSGKMYQWIQSPFENDIQYFPEWLENITSSGPLNTTKFEQTIMQGERNNTLFNLGVQLSRDGIEEGQIFSKLHTKNIGRCKPQLAEAEVRQIATSAAKYSGTKRLRAKFHYTDLGNAKRLLELHGEDIRFLADKKVWLIWDEKRWKQDGRNAIYKKIEHTIAVMHSEASDRAEKEERVSEIKWALVSESKNRMTAMETLSRTQVSITSNSLDTNPMQLNVRNGTLDLKSGTLHPHSRSDLITRLIDIDYDPHAKCPKWECFIDEVFGSDSSFVRFVQNAVGYSLTGLTDEQCLFFLYGTGANGKTTFLEVIQKLFNGYTYKIDTNSLLDQKGFDKSANPYVANLLGVRLAIGTEIGDGKRINEALIKSLTGGDTITARRLYNNPITFKPSHKLWLFGNYKPSISDDDHGIWRRIKIIPFHILIPEESQKPMSVLLRSFQEEAKGILTWAIKGCLDWQKRGLGNPEAVDRATQVYRGEEDRIQQFLDECCDIIPGCRVQKNLLFNLFLSWAHESNDALLRNWSKKKFTHNLTKREITLGGHSRTEYLGICIKDGANSRSLV